MPHILSVIYICGFNTPGEYKKGDAGEGYSDHFVP